MNKKKDWLGKEKGSCLEIDFGREGFWLKTDLGREGIYMVINTEKFFSVKSVVAPVTIVEQRRMRVAQPAVWLTIRAQQNIRRYPMDINFAEIINLLKAYRHAVEAGNEEELAHIANVLPDEIQICGDEILIKI